MKKKSRFSILVENKKVLSCFYISFVNYKHIRALYGVECCSMVFRLVQRHMFSFGFSFVSITQDEMVVSGFSNLKETTLSMESILVFFSTSSSFGKKLPVLPVLSASELVSSISDVSDYSSIKNKSDGYFGSIAPPQFTNEWRAKYEFEMNLCQRFLEVLEGGGCSLFLQPVSDLERTTQPYSEALLRFSNLVMSESTQCVVSALEVTGLIRVLDRYVVNSVIQRLKVDSDAVIGCNISALSFNLDCWWDAALQELKKLPDVAGRLVIELTEGAVIENCPAFLRFATTLKKIGVRFALDDFGAGVSRNEVVREFDFDYVKLDKKLIKNLAPDSLRYRYLSNAVIIFKQMGAKIVAEGVEQEHDVDIAQKLGCDYVQGYHIGKPSEEKKIWIEKVGLQALPVFGLSLKI